MAYNRKNKHLLIKDVQEIYLRHKQADISVMRIYREHIYPRFRISRATFYHYLTVPAFKLIKEQNQQLRLFD